MDSNQQQISCVSYKGLTDRSGDSSEDDSLHSDQPGIPSPSASAVWNLLESIRQDPSLTVTKQHKQHMYEGTSKNNGLENCSNPSSRKETEESSSFSLDDNPLYLDPRDLDPRTCQISPAVETDSNRDNKKHTVKHLMFASHLRGSEDQYDGEEGKESSWRRNCIMAVLVVIWIMCTVILITKKEKVATLHQVSVAQGKTKSYFIMEHPTKTQLGLIVQGALLPHYYANLSTRWLTVWVEKFEATTHLDLLSDRHLKHSFSDVSEKWVVPLVSEELIDVVPELSAKKVFQLSHLEPDIMDKCFLRIQLQTNLKGSFPVSLNYDLSPIDMEDGVIYAALVLCGLYLLIIFEVVHRTLAAMLAATMSVAILAALDERPAIGDIASWIDSETLLLLFSMMLIVGIFSETGIFDYLSVYTYKITNGRVWPLINTLCFLTAFLSSFLDNVTTSLLMTPVTLRLCEVMELNPVPVLMTVMIFSNIGGALTPVGDPPNVIVASHPDVVRAGVDFGVFFVHMSIGIAVVAVVIHFQLRYMFRDPKVFRFAEPQAVQELRHEIAVWQRAAASLSSYSKDEDNVRETLMKKARRLLSELKMRLLAGGVAPCENYTANLEGLKEKYPIRNWPLLYKSGLSLAFVITVFFLHSIPELNLSLGCTAFLGAVLLLILAETENVEGVLARVEWSTLLFFASLFILMEALSRLRLIEWIGRQTESVILSVEPDYQLSVAILLILWVSACASAFVDNIPLTTMMVRIVTSLAQNPQLGLPLTPLVWALCFGACLGGIATPIGSSSNVVCAGVAEQHGYRFTFIEYFKVGFPVMVVSVSVCTVYLMIAHIALGWNT